MGIEKYSIGGTVQETQAFEAFADIPQNRVLMAEKLTARPPVKPEIILGLTSVEQVFDHFKPNVDVQFETDKGAIRRETLHFKTLADFGLNGITAQSSFLSDLTMKRRQHQKIIKQLKTNKLLRQALSHKETKEAIINALHAMILELEEIK